MDHFTFEFLQFVLDSIMKLGFKILQLGRNHPQDHLLDVRNIAVGRYHVLTAFFPRARMGNLLSYNNKFLDIDPGHLLE